MLLSLLYGKKNNQGEVEFLISVRQIHGFYKTEILGNYILFCFQCHRYGY